MADHKRKRRKNRSSSRSSSRSRSRSSAHARSRFSSSSQRSVSHLEKSRMATPKQSNSLLLPFLFITTVVAFFYLSQDKKKSSYDSAKIEQPGKKLTIEERVKQKEMSLKLKQDIGSQEAEAEKFKEPVGKIDPLEPKLSPLDMGIHFPGNPTIKEVFNELNEKPFENDKYEDPEEVVRRQISHQEWLDKHLEERNAKEKRDFIRNFVKTANEQGYNVYLTKDMKAILEPIDPDEQKKEQFDEVKINWK